MKGKGLWRSCACIHLRRVRVRVDESTHTGSWEGIISNIMAAFNVL
jgi:hypothetical protein